RVVRQKDVWVLQDLDSTNGTLVNGTWLTGPHALAAGDEIGLGEAVLLVYQEEGTGERDTAPAQPAKASPPPPPGRTKPPDRRDFSVGPVPKPPRRGSPMRGAAAEPRPDRTGLWLGIGCFVLLLIVACTSVLLLDTLGLLPSLLYEPLRWLGLM
ncbi:MAG: FHA domain-containing protein, partial [Anaerolineae bacterium]